MFFSKQKTAYEMRISDWSSDVCSSDLSQAPDRLSRTRPRRSPGRGVMMGIRTAARLSAHRHREWLPSRVQTAAQLPADRASAPVGDAARRSRDRKRVVEGKSVSVRVDLGGGRFIKQKKEKKKKR